MGVDTLTQAQAWVVYDRFFEDSRVHFLGEPQPIERGFRRKTERQEVSPKQWSDGYFAAFAEAAVVDLVTFDKALAGEDGECRVVKALKHYLDLRP